MWALPFVLCCGHDLLSDSRTPAGTSHHLHFQAVLVTPRPLWAFKFVSLLLTEAAKFGNVCHLVFKNVTK